MVHLNLIITFVADEKQKLRKNKRDKIRESGQRAQSRRIVITRSMGVTITSIKGIYRRRATWCSFFRSISQGRERKGNGKIARAKRKARFFLSPLSTIQTFHILLRFSTRSNVYASKYLYVRYETIPRKIGKIEKIFKKRSPREHRSHDVWAISFGIVRKYQIIVVSNPHDFHRDGYLTCI